MFLIELAIGFLPLFGGPGYESALATGVFLPSVIAVLAVNDLGSTRRAPFDAFCRAIATGALLWGGTLVACLIHGARLGFCDPWSGLESFGLGPGVGSLIAGAWAWLVSEVGGGVRSRRWRVALLTVIALAGPIGSILVGVARFYTSPIIFGFDPFVGYFSGSMYDTVIDLSPLVTYRAASLATLAAGFIFSLHLARDDKGRIHYESVGRPGLLLVGVASAVASITLMATGARLGHYQTRATIEDALGLVLRGDRCDVVYPRSLPADQATRFLRECEEHVRENEAWLGVHDTPRITAFLFESAAQKAKLMGAGGTNIAKPWRHEVYVQLSSYPHHVVGHEVMHVVAGDAARGPFKVAGAWGGLIPNPGLIEGVAVASNPEDEDLSPDEWAKAMRELKILPPLSRLFAFGFFGENSNTAYTVSGAFVGFIHDKYGPEAIVAWYGGQDLPSVTHATWAELEDAWHEELDRIVLPEKVYAIAKARFGRPAIFGRRCPRVVDACKEKGAELASEGDARGAIDELERAAVFDPADPDLELQIAGLRGAAGNPALGRQELEALVHNNATPQATRDKAIEELADQDLASGAPDDAQRGYAEVLLDTLDESKRRTLAVKQFAASHVEYRDAIVTLLIGKPGKRPDRGRAYEMLAALDVTDAQEGLAAYLLARYDVDGAEYDLAAARLDSALARTIGVGAARVEAKRLRMVVACARGEADTARRLFADYAKEPTVVAARALTARRLVERCTNGPLP